MDQAYEEHTDYDLTEDQRLAMQQMQKLQQELDDDEDEDLTDYGLGYPDYDVQERLKEINAQWDKEPLPDDKRHRLIEFKSDKELTSVYAPPPFPGEEAEASGNNGEATPNDPDQGGLSETMNSKLTVSEQEPSGSLPGKPLPNENNNNNSEKSSKKPIRFGDDYDDKPQEESSTADDDIQSNMDDGDTSSSVHPERPTNGVLYQDGESSSSSQLTQGYDSTDRSQKTGEKSLNHQDDETTSEQPNQKEERVLVEINGRFELVSASELQAMGYPLPSDMQTDSLDQSDDGQSNSYDSYERTSRPKSSVGPRGHSAQSSTNRRSRVQSAQPTSYSRTQEWDISGYVSPYALTKEQKNLKDRREKLIRERQKAYQERRKEEDKKKHEEAESAFQWWLSKKEEERRQRLSEQNQEKPEDKQAKQEENETVFNAWCEAKREQQKKERLLKLREQKEKDDGYFYRSREECDQAFRRWLKNKRKQQHMITRSAAASKPKSRRRRSKTRPVISIKLE